LATQPAHRWVPHNGEPWHEENDTGARVGSWRECGQATFLNSPTVTTSARVNRHCPHPPQAHAAPGGPAPRAPEQPSHSATIESVWRGRKQCQRRAQGSRTRAHRRQAQHTSSLAVGIVRLKVLNSQSHNSHMCQLQHPLQHGANKRHAAFKLTVWSGHRRERQWN
jgi:hypothetical protein